MIKKSNSGATSKNALILFFLSAYFKLISKGIPSVVSICFVSLLINKKGDLKKSPYIYYIILVFYTVL